MTSEEREAGWLVETVMVVVTRARTWPAVTVRVALEEIQREAGEDSDPNTAGALLRICGALEGVLDDAEQKREDKRL